MRQPLARLRIRLKSGAIIGAEALSRWKHPERGLVPPAQFIPIAEKCGLILPIGAWILREACTQARAWADAGEPAKMVTVNISEIQLRSLEFLWAHNCDEAVGYYFGQGRGTRPGRPPTELEFIHSSQP